MKSLILLTVLMLGLCVRSEAAIYNGDPANATMQGGLIPDGNLSGWFETLNVSGAGSSIVSVSVNLTLSGGYNGDLYAYISYGGALVPLLNRVGVGTGPGQDAFGYDTAGLNITLADGAALNIHNVASPLNGGTYSPDGRAIDPLSAPSAFNAGGTIDLSAFSGMNPNGNWTLFFADVSGGETTTITGWSLDIITAVPEPVNAALGIFAGLFVVVSVLRTERVKKMFGKTAATTDNIGD